MNISNRFFPRALISTIGSGLILLAASAYADDTEVFFGGAAIGSDVKPNILFVLDNSGSMAWRTASNENPRSGEESRLTILKRAFSDLITSMQGVNAGVMVLNSRPEYGNTRMAYPITDIDKSASSGAATAGLPEILQSGDDASQIVGSSTAVIDEPTLPMGYQTSLGNGTVVSTLRDTEAFHVMNTSYACSLQGFKDRPKNTACRTFRNDDRKELIVNEYAALMLFEELDIPAGVTISSATLSVTPSNNQPYNTTLFFQAEQNKTALPLSDNDQFTNRTFSAERSVVNAPNWQQGVRVNVDVTPEINALKARAPAASPLTSALFKFWINRNPNSNDREICMRAGGKCSASQLPTLTITYTSAGGTQARTVALRFQNVGIPQGATITSARIDMVPAASNSAPLTLQVRAEATGDAAVFTNSTNLSTRAKTSALTTWAAPAWLQANPPTHEEGPDVRGVVQEVVNLPSWCGNNAMAFHFTPSAGTGSRTAVSFDGAPGQQPVLVVQYTGGTSGCLNPIFEARISQPKNDAWEDDNNNKTVSLTSNPLPLDKNLLGARYESLPIIKNAQVMDARVIVTPANTQNSPSLSVGLNFENTGNSAAFTSNNGNLSSRSKTSSRNCTIDTAGGGWSTGVGYTCAPGSLASDLQSIFAKSTWAPGNALSLFLTPANDSNLDIRSYEGVPAESITLRLKLKSGSLTTVNRTVRNELNDVVQSMFANNSTPIVPTLDEAVTYYRGNRAGTTPPMTSACQPNHLVLLTDGQANGNSTSARNSIAALAGACNSSWDDGEICGRELTKFIYENDLSSTLEGKQNIKVHTIGFALNASSNAADIQQFLVDLASPKQPDTPTVKSFYPAADASALKSAFESISQEVMSVDTTFVAPGATVNQFSRKSYKNELYFSLFRPKATDAWPGNLKRYGITSAGIVDADGLVAVKADSTFLDSARSYWSASADGNNTQAGGAASNLTNFATRKMLTFIGDSVPAGGAALDPLNTNLLTSSTAAARVGGTTQLTSRLATKFNESDPDEQLKLINWIRGSLDGSSNSAASNQRKAMGDPLHSEPVLATFGCNSYSDTTYSTCTAEDQSVFIGNNEGLLQSINTIDGSEDFSFMPEELLINIGQLKDNLESTSAKPRPYGMDNTVSLWVNDANNNGVIYGGRDTSQSTPALLSGLNSGEFVYAYATMRRGGRSIYALDVTDRSNPKLLWQITGGKTTGFSQLGQTWSAPVVTKIKVGSTIKNVLIFAGGYNELQDNKTSYSTDGVGNALYIVDATTGALIWSATATGSPTLTLSKMIYSMPASPRAIDLDGDGLADQFFIGDMGGQLWRFFINNGSTGSALVSPTDSDGNATLGTADGVFASIGGLGAANFRRFYNSPDVALTKHNGQLQLAVSIGSGYRAHPLDASAEDRFYSFRTSQVYGSASAVAHTTITESNLYDATSNVLQTGTDSAKATALTQLNASKGWMVKLTQPGEKALSESLTYLGGVFFTTYSPGNSDTNLCQAVAGTSRFYALGLTDATAYGWQNSSPSLSRYRTLATVGIPPRPIIVHLDGGPSKVCIGTDCTDVEAISFDPIPTYWIDK